MDTEFIIWSMTNNPATIAKLSDAEQIDLCEKVFNWQRASENRALDAVEKQNFKAFEIEVAMQGVLAQINKMICVGRLSRQIATATRELFCNN